MRHSLAIVYPCGLRQKINEFALQLRKTDAAVSLITVGNCSSYVYRYEEKLNGLENAVVLRSYLKKAFHQPNALRIFISTDVSLSTCEILDWYLERWPVEVFFCWGKDKLAFVQYQFRSSRGIRKYLLLTLLVHLIVYIGSGETCPFEDDCAIF